jgi:hypothetical protein
MKVLFHARPLQEMRSIILITIPDPAATNLPDKPSYPSASQFTCSCSLLSTAILSRSAASPVLLGRNHPSAPAAPAPSKPISLSPKNLAAYTFVFPLGNTSADLDHAEQLLLHHTPNPFYFMTLVTWLELRTRRTSLRRVAWEAGVAPNAATGATKTATPRRERPVATGLAEGCRAGEEVVGIPRVGGIAIGLLLTLAASAAGAITRADGAAITLANPGSKAAERGSILIPPSPNAMVMVSL